MCSSSSAPASSTNGLSGLHCPLLPTPCYLASPRYLLGPISVPLPRFSPTPFPASAYSALLPPHCLCSCYSRCWQCCLLRAPGKLQSFPPWSLPDPPSSRACAFPRSVHVCRLKSDLLKARLLVRFPSPRELLGCRDLDASPLSSSVPRMVGVY